MKPMQVIGTSGSPDYLHATTGSQRFWSLAAAPVAPVALDAAGEEMVQWLVRLFDGRVTVTKKDPGAAAPRPDLEEIA